MKSSREPQAGLSASAEFGSQRRQQAGENQRERQQEQQSVQVTTLRRRRERRVHRPSVPAIADRVNKVRPDDGCNDRVRDSRAPAGRRTRVVFGRYDIVDAVDLPGRCWQFNDLAATFSGTIGQTEGTAVTRTACNPPRGPLAQW